MKGMDNGNISYSGLFIDIINVMAEFINFKYVLFLEFVLPLKNNKFVLFRCLITCTTWERGTKSLTMLPIHNCRLIRQIEQKIITRNLEI